MTRLLLASAGLLALVGCTPPGEAPSYLELDPLGIPSAWDDSTTFRSIDGGISAFYTSPGTERGDEVDPELDDAIATVIDQATDRVSLSLFEFDRQVVVDALLAAHARGVDVEFVGDGDEEHDDGYEQLHAAGIDLSLRPAHDRIMHNKFAIIDDRWVWTGSTNFSENGVMLNNNGSLLLDSPELATVYRAEFEQMFLDGSFGRKKAPVDNALVATLGSHELQVHFSPANDPIAAMLETLDKADHSVLFMIFSFTHADIRDKLIELHNRGVQVVGVFDESQGRGRYSVDEELAEAGIPIYIDGNNNAIGFAGGKLHHKSMIVDAMTASDPTVTLGSYNWSANATDYNDENLLVVKGGELAAAYAEEFCGVLAVATPSESYVGELVDPCASLLSQVRVNEWMANPDGRDSGLEWVELVNAGLSPIDITGYTLGDSTRPDRHVFDAHILGPGEGIVVADSEQVASRHRVLASSGSLALGNSSDSIVLRDANAVVVDQTSWTSAISGESFNRGADGASTGDFVSHSEISDLLASPGTFADGTPFGGTLVINEVLPNPSGTDSGNEYVEFFNPGPALVDVSGWSLEDGIRVRHVFPPSTVVAPGAYLVVFDDGDHSDVVGAVNSSTGTLSLNNADEVLGLFDADGELRDLVEWTDTPDGSALVRAVEGDADADLVVHPDPYMTPGGPADGGPYGGVLVINELMPDPEGSDTDKEWVEVVNVGLKPALLTGWTLGDAVNPARHAFEVGQELPAGASIVIFDGPSLVGTVASGVEASSGSLSLNNSGDLVTLTDAAGSTYQAVNYGVASAGVSFTRGVDGDAEAVLVKHDTLGANSSPGTRADGSSW